MSNLDKYQKELDDLINYGRNIYKDLVDNKDNAYKFLNGYQKWYTQSLEVVRQVLPNRIEEFIELYQGKSVRKSIELTNFTIQDWMRGTRSGMRYGNKIFDDYGAITMRFHNQTAILEAAKTRFSSSLYDIMHIVQFDLYDSELDAAEALNKKGFTRGAGAIAGVVLEAHLQSVAINHNLKFKKNPTINDLAQLLKDNTVIEIPAWRKIQHLGDIRNLCDHKKSQEPSNEDIEELIQGTKKLLSTVF